jgi:hypothetical protein
MAYLLETFAADHAALAEVVTKEKGLDQRRATIVAHREGVKNALGCLGYQGPEVSDDAWPFGQPPDFMDRADLWDKATDD